jgi:hypothetical protein
MLTYYKGYFERNMLSQVSAYAPQRLRGPVGNGISVQATQNQKKQKQNHPSILLKSNSKPSISTCVMRGCSSTGNRK